MIMISFATLPLLYPIRVVSINMQEAVTEVRLEPMQFSQIVPIAF